MLCKHPDVLATYGLPLEGCTVSQLLEVGCWKFTHILSFSASTMEVPMQKTRKKMKGRKEM
jgi:hypothetical protein